MKDKPDDPLKLARWLEGQPSLEELQRIFPHDWAVAQEELADAIRDKSHGRLDALLRPKLAHPPPRGQQSLSSSRRDAQELLRQLVRRRMATLAIERYLKDSLISENKRNLPITDRFIFRRLFFDKDYNRKLVSNVGYRTLWPLVRRPNLLLPLAEAHGIYCFFSKRLIAGICKLVNGRPCIEIASGDGALSRFMRARGVAVTAFDNYSWAHKITYPPDVVKCDAATAVRLHSPEVVICSWPPAKNSFEREVFRSRSVSRYIVIGSEHKFAFGNWKIYRSQRDFSMQKEVQLSRYLLPPEFGSAVYVFDRKDRAAVTESLMVRQQE